MTTTTTKEALEPTLEELAIEAAALLDSLPTYVSDNTIRHARQIAFALRSRVSAPIVAPVVDDPEDVAWERQSTVNAIAYEFMKLFGATAKDGWTHDEMQPVFDAAREIITRTFPVLIELHAAAPASTVAPQQSDAATLVKQWIATLQEGSHVTDEDAEDLVFRIIAHRPAPASPAALGDEAEMPAPPDWRWYDTYLRATGYTDLANRMLTEFKPGWKWSEHASPAAPSTLARKAAEEIVPSCLSRTCFIRDCHYDHCWGCDDAKKERERVTTIIERCFAAES